MSPLCAALVLVAVAIIALVLNNDMLDRPICRLRHHGSHTTTGGGTTRVECPECGRPLPYAARWRR